MSEIVRDSFSSEPSITLPTTKVPVSSTESIVTVTLETFSTIFILKNDSTSISYSKTSGNSIETTSKITSTIEKLFLNSKNGYTTTGRSIFIKTDITSSHIPQTNTFKLKNDTITESALSNKY